MMRGEKAILQLRWKKAVLIASMDMIQPDGHFTDYEMPAGIPFLATMHDAYYMVKWPTA